MNGPPGLADLQPDIMEKPPDLDQTITVSAMLPATPQMWQKKTPTEKMPTNSEKKKKAKKKKLKGGEVAGLSMSTAKKMGPKEATLKEALDEVMLRDVLDVALGVLDEPAPPGVQVEAVSLQEAAPVEGEWMEMVDEAAPPREARGMTLVADFARLTVSMGMPKRQEVSTLPVMPPVPEQAGPQDVEMAAPEPDTVILEEDAAGTPEVPPSEALLLQVKKLSQQMRSPK